VVLSDEEASMQDRLLKMKERRQVARLIGGGYKVKSRYNVDKKVSMQGCEYVTSCTCE